MFRDRNDVWTRLSELWNRSDIPVLETKDTKYALLSDIHLGNGGNADDFVNNENALLKALDYYWENGFSIILLGDIEEFWQFDLSGIRKRYGDTVYARLRRLPKGNVIRVFGNHDYEWGGFVDPAKDQNITGEASEAVKLKDPQGKVRFLLVHGHQGTIDSDKFAWFSRFWVRIFGFIEPFARTTGLYNNPTSTKSPIARDYERTLYQWAKANHLILICGHSHRAIFASKSHAEKISEQFSRLEWENSKSKTTSAKRLENLRQIQALKIELEDERVKGRVIEATDPGNEPLPCYFNTGCGVYSDGLTCLEITEDVIRLVKWNRDSTKVSRLVYNEDKLSSILSKI